MLALASRIEAKATLQKTKAAQKVWAQRHSLLQQWRVWAGREKFKNSQAASTSGTGGGGSESGGDTWVDQWAVGWRKAFLTPEGAASLMQAIPEG